MLKNLYRPNIVILLLIVFASCQKEDLISPANRSDNTSINAKKAVISRPYKDSFDTWYMFVPDVNNGWNPQYGPVLAWYPGGGEGTCTHMGNSHTYFNQYVPLAPPPISSLPSPVTQFFSTQLTQSGYPGIPNNVSTITYDDNGNSIWFYQTSSVTTPVSETRLTFVATADIVGGTGKFEGAKGSTTIKGYLNPVDQSDAGFRSEGTIVY